MSASLSPNTQAILLLTAPLIAGRRDASTELLKPGEYRRMAGRIFIDTAGSVGNTDTVVEVYDTWGCAPLGSLLGCDDDSGPGATSLLMILGFTGQQIKIRIGSKGIGGPEGLGKLNIICLPGFPPPNDSCENATVAVCGVNGWSNAAAVSDGPLTTVCEAAMTRDIWFHYTATGAGVVLIDTAGSIGNFDTVLAVYDGWSCAPLGALLACNNDAFPLMTSAVAVPVAMGQNLLIRVSSNTVAGPEGAGVLTLACP